MQKTKGTWEALFEEQEKLLHTFRVKLDFLEQESFPQLKSANAELLETLEDNNRLLLTLSRDALVREDYRSTVVADQIRDNYEAIRKAKGE